MSILMLPLVHTISPFNTSVRLGDLPVELFSHLLSLWMLFGSRSITVTESLLASLAAPEFWP